MFTIKAFRCFCFVSVFTFSYVSVKNTKYTRWANKCMSWNRNIHFRTSVFFSHMYKILCYTYKYTEK